MFALLAFFFAGLSPNAWSYTSTELLTNRLDPRPRYFTLRTSHFDVHYPAHLSEVAQVLAAKAEGAYGKVVSFLGIQADRTNLVVTDQSDEPQIYTFVFPQRQIFVNVALPEYGIGLNQYADWHDWLLTHEFTHIVDQDLRGGLYQWLSPILGSWVRPRMTSPPWLREGLAVYLESTLTPYGRGPSSEYRMMMRAACAEGVLENSEFAKKDTIATFENKKWPWGVRPYLFGYYLIRTIAAKNRPALGTMLQTQAASVPFVMGAGYSSAGFQSFDEIWDETIRSIHADCDADLGKIRTRPVTPVEYLTNVGHIFTGTSLSPDGKTLLVTRDHPDYPNALLSFALDGESWKGPETVVARGSGYQTSFSRSGRFIAFDEATFAKRFYRISDISLYDLKTSQTVSVSPYLHARDPDIHPDGKNLVYVINEKGRNRLVMSDSGWNDPHEVISLPGYRRLSGPRFSPDGGRIALSVHNPRTGGEDLWLVLVKTGERSVLLSDGSRNLFPSWSTDGRRLTFSSDRTGVANVYSVDISSRRLTQLSNVEGGFFFPVVDSQGKWVYGIAYRAHGYDVARFRLTGAAGTQPQAPAARDSGPELPDAPPAHVSGSVSEYRGSRYLLPQYIAPEVYLRPGASQLGFTTASVDPLFFQHYRLTLRYDWLTRLPVGNFYYFNGTQAVAFDWDVTHDATPVPGFPQPLKDLNSTLGVHIPLSREGNHLYLQPFVFAQSVALDDRTNFAGAGVTLTRDTAFKDIGYAFPEAGSLISLGARQYFQLSQTGGRSTSVEGSITTHHALGWPRHALHFTVEGASFLGPVGTNQFFTIGGVPSFPYSLRSKYVLQGAGPNALIAERLALGTALYTFSLIDIQRGLGATPIYLGRLSAAIRLQALAIPRSRLLADGFPGSAGAELHQSLAIGQLFDFDAQFGVYHGSNAIGGETLGVFSLSSSK
jgi:hypothetical protein